MGLKEEGPDLGVNGLPGLGVNGFEPEPGLGLVKKTVGFCKDGREEVVLLNPCYMLIRDL